MASNSITQRIALTGGAEIKAELEALGKDGEAAFKKLQDAAQALKGPGPELSASLKRVQADLKNVGDAFVSAGQKIAGIGKQVSLFVSLPAAALNAAAQKAFLDFDRVMSELSVHVDTSKESLAAMGEEIRRIARTTPASLEDVGKGLSEIRDAGIGAADAFNVLNGSTKLAVATQTSVASASRLVASAIKAFNLEGKDQTKVFDLLFRAAEDGRFALSDLADVFGKSAGTITASKVQLDEYLAALAALSTTGLSASAAQKALNAVIDNLAKGGKDVEVVFKRLGVSGFGQLVQKSGGLVNAFKAILGAAGGNEQALTKLFGTTQGYATVLELAKTQNVAFTATLTGMRSGINALDPAFKKIDESAEATFGKLGKRLNDVLLVIGQDITPGFLAMADAVVGIIEKFKELPPEIRGVFEGLIGFLAIAGPALLALGAAIQVVGFAMSGLAVLIPIIVAIGVALASPIAATIAIVAGVALLTVALVGLASGQSAAGKAADDHRKMMEDLHKAIDNVKNGTDKSGEGLKKLRDASLASAQAALVNAKAQAVEKDAIVEKQKAALAANQTGPGAVNGAIRDAKVAHAAVTEQEKAIADLQRLINNEIAATLSGIAKSTEEVSKTMGAVAVKAKSTVTIIRGNSSGAAHAIGDFQKSVVSVGDAAKSAAGDGSAAFDKLTGSVKGGLTAISGLKDTIKSAGSDVFRVTDDTGKVLVEIGKGATEVGAAIDQVSASVAGLANTSAQLKEAANIVGVADAANQVVIALQAAGNQAQAAADAIIASGQRAISGWAAVPQAIADAAAAGGVAVQQLVLAFQGIGDQINAAFTGLSANIESAFSTIVAAIQAQLSSLESMVAAFVSSVSSQLAQLNQAIAAAQSRLASAQASQGRAGGGAVWGAGTSTSDSILARLSNGEFVIRAAAVKHYGQALFEALNSIQFPGFNMGGMVAALAPSRAIPSFAGGGSVQARPINLTIDGKTFGMNAPADVAESLDRFVTTKRARTSGRRPSWY